VSPEADEYARAVPSHDPDLFEDVDAPDASSARGSAGWSGPVRTPAPTPELPRDGQLSPAGSAFELAPEPDAGQAPNATVGRLFRSAGASGPLAERAIPALVREGHLPDPAVAAAVGFAATAAPAANASGSVRVYSATDEPVLDWAEPARPTSAPAWLAPAAFEPGEAADSEAPARPALLGRPTFARAEHRSARTGDGLLLATDGLTLLGEIALVGAAATFGALIDVIFGGGLGLMFPLLLFVAALYGAWRIRPSERLMAIAVPPVVFFGVLLVIGQLGLPAGRHLLTREALLLFNTLSGSFLWLVVTLLGSGAVLVLRSRSNGGTKVAA